MPGTKDQRKQRKEGKETEQWFVVVWENDCAKTEKAFIVALGDNNVLQWDAIQRGKWNSFRGLQSLLGQQVRAQQNKKKKITSHWWWHLHEPRKKTMNGYSQRRITH